MSEIRSCFKCKKAFPATGEFFFRHAQRSDGLHSWCKACCKDGNERSKAKKYSTFEGRIPTFLLSCKRSAASRGQEFSLTRQDFLDMWAAQEGLCVYTGYQMDLQANTLYSVSVERIDSSKGYVPENTVLCCNAVNRMKSDLRADDFYDFCKAVALWLSDDNMDLAVEFEKNG